MKKNFTLIEFFPNQKLVFIKFLIFWDKSIGVFPLKSDSGVENSG